MGDECGCEEVVDGKKFPAMGCGTDSRPPGRPARGPRVFPVPIPGPIPGPVPPRSLLENGSLVAFTLRNEHHGGDFHENSLFSNKATRSA